MNFDTYHYIGLKIKSEEEMPELWNQIINDVDYFIADFLSNLHIDVDFFYTTNVGVLKFDSGSSKRILWDVSFWSMYLKYLEFVFWAEHECKHMETERKIRLNKKTVNTPSNMKYNIFHNGDLLDANRLVFLPCIFEYLSYQFYNDASASYMFSLLRNENMCSMPHNASGKILQEYEEYLSEQLLLAKLFCAGHEIYHLKVLDPSGMDYSTYSQRVMYNLVTFVQSKEFAESFIHDPKLVADVRARVGTFHVEDKLFDELYADAASLDLLDVLVNYKGYFDFTFEHFIKGMRIAIENFYAFNILTYDLYTIWKYNFEREIGCISDKVYQERVHIRDVESTIRGLVFPIILWHQLDAFIEERQFSPISTKERGLSIRYEMIQFFNIAYNDTVKKHILNAHKVGFKNRALSIETARDILIGWDDLKNYPEATVQDLFLGGNDNEDNYVVFVRGY